MKKFQYSIHLTTLLFLIFTSGFFLQTGLSAQDNNTDKNNFNIEDATEKETVNHTKDDTYIVQVNAQKREQKIQDVPGSVTALTAEQVKNSGIESTADIYRYVPNFTTFSLASTGYGFSYYSIRGQSNFNNNSNSIGIYIDDIPRILSGNQTDSCLWDTEQIEILRGPQGNLYGLNSSGGVINITTKKPENHWTGSAGASYGSYNARRYKASLSGPIISDELYFSFSGTYNSNDSYVDEEGTNDRTAKFGAARGQIRWMPSEKLEIMANAESGKLDKNFNWFTFDDDDPYTIPDHNYDEKDNSTYHVQSLKVKYRTPFMDIISVTGNTIYNMDTEMEMFTGGSMYRISDWGSHSLMEELRLVSNNEASPLKWMAGGFIQKGTDDNDTLTVYAGTVYGDVDSELEKTVYSLFGQASYTFFKSLTFTAGLRYDRNTQKYKEVTEGISMATFTPYTRDVDTSETWDAVSPRFSVDYRIADEMMIYTSMAKGFKSGGFTSSDDVDQRFDPENAWSYEMGTKTNWFKNRLIFNLCGFYTVVDDMQSFYYDAGYNFVYKNTGKAAIYGVETELAVRPVRGLEISLPLGYVHTEIKEHENEANEGNKVPLTPEYTAGLTAQYTHITGIFARGEWNLRGKTYFNEENTLEQNTYSLFNAKAGYKSDHFTVSAYIDNALDKEYYTYLYANTPYNFAAVGAPRTIGAEVTLEF